MPALISSQPEPKMQGFKGLLRESSEPQEVSSEKRPGHMSFLEENLMHAISMLRYVWRD